MDLQMRRSVTVMNESFRPTNTQKCHEPKFEEYFEFCEFVYPEDRYKYNINSEKVYRFMFYTAFREQKRRGGKKNSTKPRFDPFGYTTIMARFDGDPCSPGHTPMPVQSNKPMAWSSWDQYRQVLKKIHKVQLQEGHNSLPWKDIIWTHACEDLEAHVKARVAFVKKATYQEKVDASFSPYSIVQHYPDIEEELWRDAMNAVGHRQICCQLRHRYCAQHTASGILRAESLYRAEISDFMFISPPMTETDVHTVEIMINQVSQGKTNHGRLLYGRAIRHRDVRLCAVGSLAIYLMYRFFITDEFKDMSVDDWMSNETWFDIKLLSDTNAHDKKKEMGKDSYGEHISRILKRLCLPMNKLLHLGRNIGAKILELLDEEDEAIRKMGQWNPSVYDTSYSAKLPMGPMRKLAGYHGNHKIYYNTRTSVEPSDLLKKSTPLGWVYEMNDRLLMDARTSDHPTAMFVINFFTTINRVFLQDMTAMAVLHPERMDHPIYREFPLFSTSAWQVSPHFGIAHHRWPSLTIR
jgi:Centromere DNA-binding protein complex CBF3 subunit, domain 2